MDPRFNHHPGVPEHIRDGIIRYIDHGIMPGSFLSAVIRNDLKESCGCADDINRPALFDIVRFFYNEAPSVCWGDEASLIAWVTKHEIARNRARAEAEADANG